VGLTDDQWILIIYQLSCYGYSNFCLFSFYRNKLFLNTIPYRMVQEMGFERQFTSKSIDDSV